MDMYHLEYTFTAIDILDGIGTLVLLFIYFYIGAFIADETRDCKGKEADRVLLGLDIVFWPITLLLRLIVRIFIKTFE